MLTRGPFLDQPPMLTNIISSRNDICGLKRGFGRVGNVFWLPTERSQEGGLLIKSLLTPPIGGALVFLFDPRWNLNAIKLSPGEHAGSPLHPHNTVVFVGADLRVCP